MPDKAITPGDKQNGGPSLDFNALPEGMGDWVRNKLGEDVPLTQETFVKALQMYQNAEKKIGQKEDALLDDLFSKGDSKLMEKIKGLSPQKTTVEAGKGSAEKLALAPDDKAELKEIFKEAQDERIAAVDAAIDKASLQAKKITEELNAAELRGQQMKKARLLESLDSGYKAVVSVVGEEPLQPYLDTVIRLLIDENGNPNPGFSGLLESRNPFRTTLITVLANSGANPDLLEKLSKPIHTEGAGYAPGPGKASPRLSKSDRQFMEAIESGEKEQAVIDGIFNIRKK